MKKIAFFLSIILFIGSIVANGQTKEITGNVTSADDEAIYSGSFGIG